MLNEVVWPKCVSMKHWGGEQRRISFTSVEWNSELADNWFIFTLWHRDDRSDTLLEEHSSQAHILCDTDCEVKTVI